MFDFSLPPFFAFDSVIKFSLAENTVHIKICDLRTKLNKCVYVRLQNL